MAAKLKKGDKVVVLAGKDKGKQGTISSVDPKAGKAVVDGVNVAIRHQRQTQTSQGGRMPKAMYEDEHAAGPRLKARVIMPHMEEELERAWLLGERYGHSLCVVIIDIDYFKQINDTYGHKSGDEVLRKVGNLLRDQARDSDTVCRFGGDEFAIIISGDTLPQKKPDPAPLLHAAKFFGIAPAASLMIGDSVSDVKAARAAGFQIVCMSYGYNHGLDIRDFGPDAVIDVARRSGIKSALTPVYSLALGTSGVSPLEMASAFATFATGGVRHEPFWIRRVEDPVGRVLEEQIVRGQRTLDADINFQMVDMMRSVLSAGTGRIIRRMGFDLPAAGKTGTSDDFRDAWFTGFTPTLSVSVWVGYDRGLSMRDANGVGITGGRAAAPIWADFMIRATSGEPAREFTVPSDIHFEMVNPVSGEIADQWTQNPVKVALRSGQMAAAVMQRPKTNGAGRTTFMEVDKSGNVKANERVTPKTDKSVTPKADKSTIIEEDLTPE